MNIKNFLHEETVPLHNSLLPQFETKTGQINDFILNLDGCLAFIESEHKRLKLKKDLKHFQREEMEKFGQNLQDTGNFARNENYDVSLKLIDSFLNEGAQTFKNLADCKAIDLIVIWRIFWTSVLLLSCSIPHCETHQ